eukprot:scaffold1752_cov188-Amphora_coffeaeformis.AAC.15
MTRTRDTGPEHPDNIVSSVAISEGDQSSNDSTEKINRGAEFFIGVCIFDCVLECTGRAIDCGLECANNIVREVCHVGEEVCHISRILIHKRDQKSSHEWDQVFGPVSCSSPL